MGFAQFDLVFDLKYGFTTPVPDMNMNRTMLVAIKREFVSVHFQEPSAFARNSAKMEANFQTINIQMLVYANYTIGPNLYFTPGGVCAIVLANK